jgi:hypothetical protein
MSDENQPQRDEQGGSSGAGTAAAPQVEAGSSERGQSSRHGRNRRRGGGGGGARPEQRQQQSSRRAEPMLNLEEVRELTELFSEHGLTDFEFENADIRIRLSRNPAPVAAHPVAPPTTTHAATVSAVPRRQSSHSPSRSPRRPRRPRPKRSCTSSLRRSSASSRR